jgi:integrase/recombinase XerC/integrase/recombinase XerD
VEDLLNQYLDNHRVIGTSEKTLEGYEFQVRRLLKWAGEKPLTEALLAEYLLSCRQVSENMPKAAYSPLKTFFKWCVERGLMKKNPLAGIRSPKAPKRVLPALTRTETRHLLSSLNGHTLACIRNKAMILTIVDTGVRASELLGMTLADLHLDRGVIMVRGKGSKFRRVFITSPTKDALQSWLAHHDGSEPQLWLGERGPLTYSGLNMMMMRLSRRLGFEVRPHKLRRTAATTMLRNGADVLTVSKILGHSSIAVTQRYLDLTDGDLQERHGRFSALTAHTGRKR